MSSLISRFAFFSIIAAVINCQPPTSGDRKSDEPNPDQENDSFSTAIYLETGEETGSFSLPSDDVDWFRIENLNGLSYKLKTSSTEGIRISLYDSTGDGERIIIDTTDELIDYSKLLTISSYGTHFFKAEASDLDSPVESYSLKFTLDSTTDQSEPDNSQSQATTHAENDERRYHILSPGDQDWIRLSVQPEMDYSFTFSTDIGLSVELYKSDKLLKEGSVTEKSEDKTVITAHSDIQSTYYLRVRATNETETGLYSIKITSDSSEIASDIYEDNDEIDEAKQLTGTQKSLTLSPSDEDYFYFAPSANFKYIFSLQDTFGIDFSIIDEDSSTVLPAESDTGTLERKIEWTCEKSGIYFLRLKSSKNGSGAYNFGYDSTNSSDPYEPDNDKYTARNISAKGTAENNHVLVTEDQDWYFVEGIYSRILDYTITVTSEDISSIKLYRCVSTYGNTTFSRIYEMDPNSATETTHSYEFKFILQNQHQYFYLESTKSPVSYSIESTWELNPSSNQY